MTALTVAEVTEILAGQLTDYPGYRVLEVGPSGAVFTAEPPALRSRPGGTVSGPAIFEFVDIAAYLTVNALLGGVVGAMLTSSSISFLEAPRPERLVGAISAVKLGRRLAVMAAEVTDADDRLTAIATLHFALPSRVGR